ncbi:hypothetical protein [Streptomyces sp. NPDC059786]|uniref:FDXHR family putative zinc-binding protein n=1 Tax=Streptomyces sp. NPDC059786 TaxID=3346946 RepID=UPI00366A3AF4
MFESVILGGQGAKVLGSVIGAVPVDVVNLVFKDDSSVDHPVLVGLDVLVRPGLPAKADVAVGGEVPTRLLLGDPFSRREVSSRRPVAGLSAGGAEPLLCGSGDLDSAHSARLLHGAILRVATLCHETFNSDSAAEKHRVGKPGIDRRCLPPAEAGLVAVEQPWGTCWQTPGSDLRFASAPETEAA